MRITFRCEKKRIQRPRHVDAFYPQENAGSILFRNLHCRKTAMSSDGAFLLQILNHHRIGAVFVDIDHPRHRVAWTRQSPAKEALRGYCVTLGREQKVDRLAGGIQRSIQILVLTFYLNVGLVDPIALVDRLQIPAAAFIQFGCIRLHPAPNATSVLSQKFIAKV